MTARITDTESEILLVRAQAGDRAALEALLARHRNGVYRYGLRVCRTTEDAEDAVQEALWAATRAIRTFRGAATSIAAWLFTIVRHQCYRLLDRHRRDEEQRHASAVLHGAARGGEEGGTDDPACFQPSVEDEAIAREQRERLALALAGLEPSYREVILLRDVEGLSAPEAAAALGISVEALKSRLYRARVTLRDRLAQPAERGIDYHGPK